MIILMIIPWLILTIITTIMGSNRKIGGFVAFLLSIVTTPIISLIIVAFSEKNKENQQKIVEPNLIGISDEINKLKLLRDSGDISENDFILLKQKIIEQGAPSIEKSIIKEKVEAIKLNSYKTSQGDVYIDQSKDNIEIGDKVYTYYNKPWNDCNIKIKKGPLLTIESGKIINIK